MLPQLHDFCVKVQAGPSARVSPKTDRRRRRGTSSCRACAAHRRAQSLSCCCSMVRSLCRIGAHFNGTGGAAALPMLAWRNASGERWIAAKCRRVPAEAWHMTRWGIKRGILRRHLFQSTSASTIAQATLATCSRVYIPYRSKLTGKAVARKTRGKGDRAIARSSRW